MAFSLARIVPYVILSIISVGIGQYLINRFYQTRESLLINFATGAFIVLLGTVIVIGKSPHLNFCAPLIKKIGSEKGTWQMVALGLLIGFAPCLPLLGVLAYIAFNAHNLAHGALLGLVFGIGTLVSPLILIGPLAGGFPQLLEKRPLVYKIFSRACGLILVYLGMGMIFRVWPAL